MNKNRINIKTVSNIDQGLLLMGVPFAEGNFNSNQDLYLRWEDKVLQLWWEPRAFWPDGSVKWIFVHSRVPAGENNLILETGTGDKEEKYDGLQKEDNILKFRNIELTIRKNLWTLTTSKGEYSLVSDETETDLVSAEVKYKVEIIEDSFIAPLIRIKPEGDKNGFYKDQLLRLDADSSRVFWKRRMTWNREGKYWLNKCKAILKTDFENTKEESIYIPEPGKVSYNEGPVEEGNPEALLKGEGYSFLVEKGWQRAPLALYQKNNRINISFYPESVKKLGITGGTSFRHQVQLSWGEESSRIAGNKVKFTFDPDYICSTGALGLLSPASKKEYKSEDNRYVHSFPGYCDAFKAALEEGRQGVHVYSDGKKRLQAVPMEVEEDQHWGYFGLQNYGDWPWFKSSEEEKFDVIGYADNEYDTGYTYFRGYATYSDWRYLRIGYWSVIHMADVDYISTSGDMHHHSHHGYRSSRGEMGHYWSDGFWVNYFLTGDIWSKEAAAGFTEFLLNYFDRLGEDGLAKLWSYAERYLGWPLVALMGSYEATGDEDILSSIKPIIDYMAKFTSDPDRELEDRTGQPGNPPDWYRMGNQDIKWWRTAMENGCKPFMVGVIMEGLERYHRVTGDPQAAETLINLANFIIDYMWCPHQAGFIYEHNALNRKDRVIPHNLIPLFVRGLGYSYELTGEEKFKNISEKAFHSCLWTLYKPIRGGKGIGQIGRTLGEYVSMAENWIEKERKEYLESFNPSSGKDFEWNQSIKKLLNSNQVVKIKGDPCYKEEALLAEGDSFVGARFKEPVATDRGEIIFETLLKKALSWENPRGYIHLCDEIHNRSCISIISFYNRFQARVYDQDRFLIEAAEAQIIDDPEMYGELKEKPDHPLWQEEEWHTVRVVWEAPGEIVLYLDGVKVESSELNHPLGGKFTRINVGYTPGNWKVNGKIRLKKIMMQKK